MVKRELKIFFTALMFFSRIPCPKWVGHSEADLNKSTRYFPLIGWICGGVCFLTLYLSLLVFPVEISVILSMISGVLLTGAFHEDGFADVCDGFGGGWNRHKILEIMKDSRIGVYGAIGLVFLFLLKFFLLKSLLTINIPGLSANISLLLLLVTAHAISRLTAISIMFSCEYAREDLESKVKPIAKGYTWKEVTGVFLFGLAPLLFIACYRVQVLLVIVPLLLIRLLMGAYFKKWIGGYTGDCLGATQQLSEIVFYLSMIALWKFTW